jgi:hypothetical protein
MKDASKTQDVLGSIDTYPATAYEALDLNRLASFTICWMQERRIPTTFENIVVAAFRMLPAKFALEGYPDFPDATRVNRALLQLRPKYRNWARGSVQKGFVLTESGLAEVAKVGEVLSGARVSWQRRQKHHLPKTMDLSRELEPVQQSSLFEKWKGGHLTTATVIELLDMLSAYAYTPANALEGRIGQLEQVAIQQGRQDLFDFFQSVRKFFADKLKDE